MSGGDLLYIFAFIILPTAVLVACIWALILLRRGALLPARSAAAHELSDEHVEYDGLDDRGVSLVEETVEHTIVAPIADVPVTIATPLAEVDSPVAVPVTDESPLVQESASVTAPGTSPVDEPPPTERTQELSVVPTELSDASDVNVEPDETPVNPSTIADDPGVASGAVEAALPSCDGSGVMIVPLDEPSRAASAECGTAPPADAANAGGDAPSPSSSPPSSARRPPRRVAQRRVAEEALPRSRPRTGQRHSAPPDGEA